MGSVGSTLDVFWVDFAKSQTPFCKGILDLQTGSVRGSISPALLSLDDPESESCTIFGKVRVGHNSLSAGINRHVVGGASPLQERRQRLHSGLESCRRHREVLVEA